MHAMLKRHCCQWLQVKCYLLSHFVLWRFVCNGLCRCTAPPCNHIQSQRTEWRGRRQTSRSRTAGEQRGVTAGASLHTAAGTQHEQRVHRADNVAPRRLARHAAARHRQAQGARRVTAHHQRRAAPLHIGQETSHATPQFVQQRVDAVWPLTPLFSSSTTQFCNFSFCIFFCFSKCMIEIFFSVTQGTI